MKNEAFGRQRCTKIFRSTIKDRKLWSYTFIASKVGKQTMSQQTADTLQQNTEESKYVYKTCV